MNNPNFKTFMAEAGGGKSPFNIEWRKLEGTRGQKIGTALRNAMVAPFMFLDSVWKLPTRGITLGVDKIRGGETATRAVLGENRFEVDTKASQRSPIGEAVAPLEGNRMSDAVRNYTDGAETKTGLYSGVAGTLLVGAAMITVGGLLSQGVFLSEARMKPNKLRRLGREIWELRSLYFDINLAAIRIVAQEQGAL